MLEYAALVASPRALPDGLILVFQHPVKQRKFFYHEGHEGLRTKKQFTTKGTKVKCKKLFYHEVHEGHEEMIELTKNFVFFVFFVVKQLVIYRYS